MIDNYPEGESEDCLAPNHPQQPELGRRALPFTRELWIERDDFAETPPKGYFRLSPGAEVRLRYALHRPLHGRREGCRRQRDAWSTARTTRRRAAARRAPMRARSRATSTGCRPRTRCRRKCGCTIGCFACRFRARAPAAESIEHDGARSPRRAHADRAGRRGRRSGATTASAITSTTSTRRRSASSRPSSSRRSRKPLPEDRFQFERHGYFVADLVDHRAGPAGVQPHGDAAGFLEQQARLNARCRSVPNRVRAAARPCVARFRR